MQSVALYEGDSISNQADLFLADRHSQDFHSVLSHHIWTYVQNFNIVGSLVDNLSRPQAWPVRQMVCFRRNYL